MEHWLRVAQCDPLVVWMVAVVGVEVEVMGYNFVGS